MTLTESAAAPATTNFVPESLHVKGDFEVSGSLYYGHLQGYIYGWITEVGGHDPIRLVRIDNDFVVHLHWTLHGQLAEYLCGFWCCGLHFESIGSGPEFDYPADFDEQHFVGCSRFPENHYWCEITVPAGTIDPSHCSRPYSIVATTQYLTDCHRPGEMAGAVNIGLVTFYEP
jgi:hypothetical protein